MAQPRALVRQPTQGPSRTALVIGGLLALAGIGVAIALSSNSAAAAPGGGSGGGGGGGGAGAGKPCPASSLPPQLLTYRLADAGTTQSVTSVDVVRTALLITAAQTAGYNWQVTSSDPTVLTKTKSTTGPDPVNLNGTDRIDTWKPMGSGTAVLTGQLLPKSGSGAAIASFAITIVVSCSGVQAKPPPQGQSRLLIAKKSYTVTVIGPNDAVFPSVAAVQASFDSSLGAGVVTVLSVGPAGSAGGVGIINPKATRIRLTVNQNVSVNDGQILTAAGGIPSPYSIIVA